MLIDKELLNRLDDSSNRIDKIFEERKSLDRLKLQEWVQLNDERINLIVEILHEINDGVKEELEKCVQNGIFKEKKKGRKLWTN